MFRLKDKETTKPKPLIMILKDKSERNKILAAAWYNLTKKKAFFNLTRVELTRIKFKFSLTRVRTLLLVMFFLQFKNPNKKIHFISGFIQILKNLHKIGVML